MACLDTTILIDLTGKGGARRRKAAENKLQDLIQRQESLVTTRFNVAELYVGVEMSNNPETEGKAINGLIADFEILEFDDPAAYVFGQIKAWQRMQGKPSGDMDVLIAATALTNGHLLVTRNPFHFRHIPELRVEEY